MIRRDMDGNPLFAVVASRMVPFDLAQEPHERLVPPKERRCCRTDRSCLTTGYAATVFTGIRISKLSLFGTRETHSFGAVSKATYEP